jgi:hypothetical protein
LSLVAAENVASAEDAPAPASTPLSVEVHAFVSQGAILSTSNNYLAKSERGSVDFNEVGINFTSQLSERLRVGLQLFSRHLGPVGNYDVKADWFYLDYRWRDWLGLRAGRVKLPFGLYNDTSDIDAARVAVLLPQSVYPVSNRDFLLAATGMELYGYIDLRAAGALEYRLYGGTIFIDVPPAMPGAPFLAGLDTPYLVGGRLLWDTPVEGLRMGGSVQALRLDATLILAMTPMMPMTTVVAEVQAVLWVASVEYAAHDLLLAAEYSRWHTDTNSSNSMLFPSSKQVNERAYAMAGYRLNQWLQTGAYYSIYYPDVSKRSIKSSLGIGEVPDYGRANMQHDTALTLRFDINSYWLVKLEAHYMHGTAGLTTALNSVTSLGKLTEDWAVFLLKTTAYF